jgi:hypothetical protein
MDINRGSRVCPSCGRENVLTASHCSFCFTSLDQGVQTTPPHPPPATFTQAAPLEKPNRKALSAGTTCGVALLVAVSFVITFVAVCFPISSIDAELRDGGRGLPYAPVGIAVGLLAGAVVGALLQWAIYRHRRP